MRCAAAAPRWQPPPRAAALHRSAHHRSSSRAAAIDAETGRGVCPADRDRRSGRRRNCRECRAKINRCGVDAALLMASDRMCAMGWRRFVYPLDITGQFAHARSPCVIAEGLRRSIRSSSTIQPPVRLEWSCGSIFQSLVASVNSVSTSWPLENAFSAPSLTNGSENRQADVTEPAHVQRRGNRRTSILSTISPCPPDARSQPPLYADGLTQQGLPFGVALDQVNVGARRLPSRRRRAPRLETPAAAEVGPILPMAPSLGKLEGSSRTWPSPQMWKCRRRDEICFGLPLHQEIDVAIQPDFGFT